MNTVHVDVGLARYSDWAFTSAVVALVVALVLLAVELAYSRTRAAGQLVAAGAVTPTARPLASSTPRLVAPSTNESGGAVWLWPMSASRCCWPASCCAGWRRCGRRGATCTSSST
ncbi:cytochrome c assembly family domain protein [Mycobacterium xenopi 3993]|nr:cytochrome c assembly family domain protein [Mycobacterium xenopi 3993]